MHISRLIAEVFFHRPTKGPQRLLVGDLSVRWDEKGPTEQGANFRVWNDGHGWLTASMSSFSPTFFHSLFLKTHDILSGSYFYFPVKKPVAVSHHFSISAFPPNSLGCFFLMIVLCVLTPSPTTHAHPGVNGVCNCWYAQLTTIYFFIKWRKHFRG